MPTRLRKIRRQRGSRTHGYGQIGQHRPHGSHGGHGLAGLHKHKWSWTVKYAPDHFGKRRLSNPTSTVIRKWLNVGDLDGIRQNISGGKQSQRKMYDIDLSKMGFDRLLGGGRVTGAYRIVVASATKTAVEKVKIAKGEVVEG